MTSPRGYSAGTAFLEIVPSFRGVQKAIASEVRQMERALGKEAGEKFGESFEAEAKKAVDKTLNTSNQKETEKAGRQAGERYAGAFSAGLKKAVREAQREVGASIKLTTDDSEVKRDLLKIRRELADLNKAKIGLNVSAGDALDTFVAIRKELKRIQDEAEDIGLSFNFATAEAQLVAMEKRIENMDGTEVKVKAKVDDRSIGLFAETVKKRLEAALKRLPDLDLDANTTKAQDRLLDLRQKINDLSKKKIGLDIDGSAALAEMEKLRAELSHIADDRTIDVSIRTDAATAATELTAIRTLAEQVDGKNVEIKVDVDSAAAVVGLERLRGRLLGVDHQGREAANGFRAFNVAILAGAALLPAVVPVLGAAAGALALMGPAALTGVAGIGALIFGFSGVTGAVKALGDAQTSALKDSVNRAQTIKSAADSMADAEASLARAREDAGRAAEDAARRVTDAVDAQQDAERDLVRAQAEVVRAQEEVTRARERAADRIEDLRLAIQGGALAEREAVLDLKEAQEEYDAAKTDPSIDADAREHLLIDLEQQKLRLEQIRLENTRNTEEQVKFNQTGIEGSEEVQRAQEGVASAQDGVRSAMERVADAAVGVQDALRDQQRTHADSSRAIGDAQRNLTQAQGRYSQALFETGEVGSASAQKVEQAFRQLGPAGQSFALFIHGMRDDFRNLRDEFQAGFLPGVQDAIYNILTVNGPLLHEFAQTFGQTLGDLFRQFGELMTGPEWQEIWKTFNDYAPIFITQLARVGGAALTFFGELFRGLAPYAADFGESVANIAENLANWMAGFVDSAQFKEFMEWLFENGPGIFQDLLDIAEAIGRILFAVAPLGTVVLDLVAGFARWINEMDPQVLGVIVTAVLGLVVAFQLASGSIALISGAFSILRTPLARGVLLFGGLLTAIVALYTQSEGFRDFINGLVGLLGDLTGGINNLLGPIGTLAAAWLAYKGYTWVKFFFMGLRVEMNKTGADAGRFTTNAGKVRTALGGIRSAAPVLIAGLALVGVAYNAAQKDADEFRAKVDAAYEAMGKGGQAAEEARRNLQLYRYVAENVQGDFPNPFARDYTEEINKATEAWKAHWRALSPVEQAQQKVAEWTNTLAAELEDEGSTTSNVEAAHRRLAFWTDLLADRQNTLDTAVKGVNERMADQQNFAISLTDAQISMAASTDALSRAHDEVARTLKENGTESQEYQDALAGLEQQSFDTTQAAGRLAEARHSDAEGAELQLWANAAILANLVEQEQKYGALPPRLQDLKDSLSETVDPAYLLATQFENLQLSVLSVPDHKSVIIESTTPEQIAMLEDMGFRVTHLPDGTYKVEAATAEAEDALAELTRDREVDVYANVQWATPAKTVTGENFYARSGVVVRKAAGGAVRGPGGPRDDTIPAWLSNGEYVIKASSVARYGIGMLDMINAGRYYMGGLVRGRQKFDDGGLAATWGGTVKMKGGDPNPLAQIWFGAIASINAAAQYGSNIISIHFANMRNFVLATIRDLRSRVLADWKPFMDGLVNSTNLMSRIITTTIGVMSKTAISLFKVMQTALTGSIAQTVANIAVAWNRLPSVLAGPVNFTIDRVLNRGLFAAFNNIVTELGLSKDWIIKPAAGVDLGKAKLAAGGRVPGYSPHDKADNIPAMLTAGEWVQPVDSVRYYGADFMEAIRKRLIPRDMFQSRATGGQIFALTQSMFPRAKLNSAYRPGANDYHGLNMAADMGEAGFVGGIGRAYIAAMKRWWVDNFGRTTEEIIYDGLGNDRPDIKNGAAFNYGAATQSEHRNHLHVAESGSLGVPTGGPTGDLLGLVVAPAWYSKYGSPAGILKVLQNSIVAVKELTNGKPGKMYGGMAQEAVEWVWSKAKGTVESMFAGIAGALLGAVAAPSGASGPVVDIVRSVASKYGWSSGNEWNALSQLIQKESSWNPTAQNPTSSAYGLFQFLNGTWATVGGYKTSDPGLQAEFGARYIKGRYGSPSAALAFHLSHNWYGEGGEVHPAVSEAADGAPVLYDTGGWLPPGITTVLNATNKPEPILTAEQWAELTSRDGDGDDNRGVDHLHIHEVATNMEEAIGAVNHYTRVARRGGRYAGVGGAA